MKIIIAVTGLALLIQTFWVFEALGANEITEECARFFNVIGCCGTGKCTFIICQQLGSKPATGNHCVSNISAADCNGTSPLDLCHSRLPDCSSYNKTSCCGVPGCELYNCTSQNASVEAETVCGKADESSCQGNKNASRLCPSSSNDTTTESLTTETTTNGTATQTTQAPVTTATQAPVTTATQAPVTTATQAPVTTATQAPVTTATQAPVTTAANGTTSQITTESTTKAETSPVTARTESTSAASANPTSGGDSGRHFDAASFIGGIVLCLGLMVIVFIGLKFYRSRSQQNYRTL